MIGGALVETFLHDRFAPFGGFAAIEGLKDETSADLLGMFFRVGLEVDIGRNLLIFARPALSGPDIPPPAITALELRIASLATTKAHLKSTGIAFMALPDGRLAVSPDEANGTSLLLAEG